MKCSGATWSTPVRTRIALFFRLSASSVAFASSGNANPATLIFHCPLKSIGASITRFATLISVSPESATRSRTSCVFIKAQTAGARNGTCRECGARNEGGKRKEFRLGDFSRSMKLPQALLSHLHGIVSQRENRLARFAIGHVLENRCGVNRSKLDKHCT